MCKHVRTHLAQDWPYGPLVEHCRDCGLILRRLA